MEAPMNAPGCFAAASVFCHDSEVCRQCCAFDACSSAALNTLEKIKGVVNVKDLLKRHEKARRVSQAAIKKADEEREATLPPGNLQQPLMKPVKRKTQVTTVAFDVSAKDDAIIAKLPVKSQQIAVALCKRGMLDAIQRGMQEGRNALDENGPAWLRVALTLLLRGGCTKSELRESIRQELNWAESSAGPHASMAWVLLTAFGVAQETEGRLVPAPVTGA